jgi:hypothetical protein
MALTKQIRSALVMLACSGMLATPLVRAAQPGASPVRSESPARDVALQAAGTLHGQVVDPQGVGRAHVDVAVNKLNQPPVVVTTDAQGRFAVEGLSAGIYQVQTDNCEAAFRVWAPRTAPPVASQAVLLVEDGKVVRGQKGKQRWNFAAGPWIIGGLAAAAIAIPLALDDGS